MNIPLFLPLPRLSYKYSQSSSTSDHNQVIYRDTSCEAREIVVVAEGVLVGVFHQHRQESLTRFQFYFLFPLYWEGMTYIDKMANLRNGIGGET